MCQGTLVECARDYAGRWLFKEQHLVAGLAGIDRQKRLAAVQRAGGYFRVSRSFGRRFDVLRGLDRLAPVLDVLDRIDQKSVTDNTLADVAALGGWKGTTTLLACYITADPGTMKRALERRRALVDERVESTKGEHEAQS
jgi:hypothetical protein